MDLTDDGMVRHASLKGCRESTMSIFAKCLRCGHVGAISDATLQHHGLGSNVTLAYLSRFAVCQECGSHAIKLERRDDEVRRHASFKGLKP
jgi:translation initiation factor 2 beta subunit (eIF-2beta)/eIF-5